MLRRPVDLKRYVLVVAWFVVSITVNLNTVSTEGAETWNYMKMHNDKSELLNMVSDSLEIVRKQMDTKNSYETINAFRLIDIANSGSKYCQYLMDICTLLNSKRQSEKEGSIIEYLSDSYVTGVIEAVVEGYKLDVRNIDLIMRNTSDPNIKILGERIKKKLTEMIIYTEKLK